MAHKSFPATSEFACPACGAEWADYAGNVSLKKGADSPCCQSPLRVIVGSRAWNREHIRRKKGN